MEIGSSERSNREVRTGLPNSTRSPLHPKNITNRDFKPSLKAAGLPEIRFHELRHIAASLMLNQGVPVFVVSHRLGHSKASITLDLYGHLIPHFQQEAAEMIEEMIAPVKIIVSHQSIETV